MSSPAHDSQQVSKTKVLPGGGKGINVLVNQAKYCTGCTTALFC